MKSQIGLHRCLKGYSMPWLDGLFSMATTRLRFLWSWGSTPCWDQGNWWDSSLLISLTSPASRQVLVSLGLTKGGKRQGAAESVILGVEQGVRLVQHWKTLTSTTTPVAHSPAHWRGLFSECLVALGLEHFQFRPYSLRRGGATWWFTKHQNLDRILVQGRWLAHRTARIYINEGLAMLAQTTIDFNHPNLKSFLNIYKNTCSTLSFSTLEPPAKTAGRAGGRGSRQKLRVRKREKFSALWSMN